MSGQEAHSLVRPGKRDFIHVGADLAGEGADLLEANGIFQHQMLGVASNAIAGAVRMGNGLGDAFVVTYRGPHR